MVRAYINFKRSPRGPEKEKKEIFIKSLKKKKKAGEGTESLRVL